MGRTHEIVRSWYKGDEYMGTDTMKNMAEKHGMTYKQLAWYCSPTGHKRSRYENRWFKVELEEDENENDYKLED